MRRHAKTLSVVLSCMMLAFGILTLFSPTIFRVVSQKETGIVYLDYQPPMADISNMVCDNADNIFVASDISDCIVVISPQGEVLYTVFFKLMDAGGIDLISMNDGSVIVDSTGSPWYRLWSNGRVIIESDKELSTGVISVDYKDQGIYMIGGNKIQNSKGEVFTRNGFTLQVISKLQTGDRKVFFSNSFVGWLVGSPFPAALWIVIGASILASKSIIKRNDNSR